MKVQLDMYQTLAIAVLVLLLGSFLRKKIRFLERFCIPAPVVGGLLFAIFTCVCYVTHILEFSFDDTLKEVCMVFFFTSVGFQANLKVLKKGGKSMVIFLGLVIVLIFIQNCVAVSLSKLLGLDSLIGMCTGSIPMVGGHGTAGAFGPVLEDFNVQGATTICTAAATFGLIFGSLVGGPLGKRLIEKKDLLSTAIPEDDSLLVEDEKSLSRAVKAILEKNNFSIDAVYDGVEALEYLETGNYDGVIMDVMMPRMDGITALRKLRTAGNMVPVLLLTAKSEIDDKVDGLDSGANDYLTKPFDTKELLARIRAMTRSANANVHADSYMHVGNITLDTASYELSSPSGSYKLANKEYQMMEMMMVNPKQLISTEHFMEKIWGYDSEAEINVVWVYISYLRKKLDALGADIQIKATRNAGYSLEEKNQVIAKCSL